MAAHVHYKGYPIIEHGYQPYRIRHPISHKPMTRKQENRTVQEHIQSLSFGCENAKKITVKSEVKDDWSVEQCRLWLYRHLYAKHDRDPRDANYIARVWNTTGEGLNRIRESEFAWRIITGEDKNLVVELLRVLHHSNLGDN